MKVATVEHQAGRSVAVMHAGSWRAVSPPINDISHLLAMDPDEVQAYLATATGEPLKDARPVAPLRPRSIVAIGLNYEGHIRESGVSTPTQPLVFAKLPSSTIGHGDQIQINRDLTSRVDWEVELAVVIGRRLRHATPAEAMESIFGYTVANDVSARDVQFGDGQWVRGKSMATFCPLGPWIVTADEIPDPQSLHLTTRVDGETLQSAPTSEMVFGVAEILSYCSQNFVLEAGDVVLTGTPWGCGEFMNPVRSLEHGSVVECEIDQIGTLRNSVVDIAPQPGA